MCGRFALYSTPARIAARFGADAAELAWTPRYNIGPQQVAPVLRGHAGGRRLDLMHWGLVPSWAQRPDIGARLFNARSESVALKPAFRSAFRSRRCVVAVDGFYEWQPLPDGSRQPYFISRSDGDLLALAGLWEAWAAPTGPWLSFTILTMAADAWMLPLHPRMPVMLDDAAVLASWLDAAAPQSSLLQSLAAPAAGTLQAWPVTRAVGAVRNDFPQLVQPLQPAPRAG